MASGTPGFSIGFPQALNVNFVVVNVHTHIAVLMRRALAESKPIIHAFKHQDFPIFGTRRHRDGATAEDADVAGRSC
jgi:hypothetical protein